MAGGKYPKIRYDDLIATEPQKKKPKETRSAEQIIDDIVNGLTKGR